MRVKPVGSFFSFLCFSFLCLYCLGRGALRGFVRRTADPWKRSGGVLSPTTHTFALGRANAFAAGEKDVLLPASGTGIPAVRVYALLEPVAFAFRFAYPPARSHICSLYAQARGVGAHKNAPSFQVLSIIFPDRKGAGWERITKLGLRCAEQAAGGRGSAPDLRCVNDPCRPFVTL